MTKKDYELIAREIKNQMKMESGDYIDAERNAISALAECLAHAFKVDNPRFSEDRFLLACGVKI